MAAACVWLGRSAVAAGQSDPVERGGAANLEYAAVFSRPETPCSDNYATTPYVMCMSKELEVIEVHLDAFVEDLRGVTGSQDELLALNQTDTTWRAYRASACQLPLRRFGTGTIKAPMSVDCQWRLDRAYMEELSGVYILSQFPHRSPSK
ncbi:MAG TPA: lysozyme inhibitor LprI family protein [Granulicella sp.]|nr:lysozyme inhibitor LprI family protein [Granulicella sp.]